MEIILDKDIAEPFESGQTVSGALAVNTDGALSALDVSIALIGTTEVEWTPERTYGMYPSALMDLPKNLYEKRTCLEMVHKVCAHDLKSSEAKHTIPFHFEIPHNISSSYESDGAEVVYKILAKVKTCDQNQHKVERKIRILAPVLQNLTLPVHTIVEKNFGVVSFGHGKIILHVTLPKKGFYPGEKIPVQCYIQNESSVECNPRATLYQTRVYQYDERHIASHWAVDDAVVGKKVEKFTDGIEMLDIVIPDDMSLTIKDPVITIKYMIHVTLDIPHAFDIHVNLPFVVSTRSSVLSHK